MTNTNKPSIVTQAIIDLLSTMTTDPVPVNALGLQAVYYGFQQLMPKVPSVAVEPGDMGAESVGAQFRTENTFVVELLVYHSIVTQSTQANRKMADQKAEDIMDVLHSDRLLGGLVYTSWVTRITPGFSRKGKSVIQATNLTWTGHSKVNL